MHPALNRAVLPLANMHQNTSTTQDVLPGALQLSHAAAAPGVASTAAALQCRLVKHHSKQKPSLHPSFHNHSQFGHHMLEDFLGEQHSHVSSEQYAAFFTPLQRTGILSGKDRQMDVCNASLLTFGHFICS